MVTPFLEQFEKEVLDTANEISMNARLSEIDEWDSLAVVSFMAMVEKSFGKKISRSQVLNASTVQDLYNLAAIRQEV